MKMRTFFASILVLCATALAVCFQAPQAFAQQQAATNRTGTVKFRVLSAEDYRPLPGARVVVVGGDGKVMSTGRTDATGYWSPTLTVPVDPRFDSFGTVTAIGIATGHNPNVVFEVPVKQGAVQPITLYPIEPRLRNEATASVGHLHHLDITGFVNRYAQSLGLEKQKGVPGAAQAESPWGPEQKQAQ